MQINISSRHGQLAAESRDRISSKLEKLKRFHDRVASVDATIDLSDEQEPRVEILVAVEGTAPFIARTNGTSLLGAVEGAVQKLEEQLRRHKEKLIGSHRGAAKRDGATNSTTAAQADDSDDDED